MDAKNTDQEYGRVARGFHWTMAVLIIGLLIMGYVMGDLPRGPDKLFVFGLHKSFGTLVLILVMLRLGWRLGNVKPKALDSHQMWERWLAHATHILLYVFMFLMPITGWLMTSAGNFPHPFFGLFNVPHIIGPNKDLAHTFKEIHETAAIGFIALISLHFAGALKHWVIDRDITIQRMWPLKPVQLFTVIIVVFAALIFVDYSLTNGKTTPVPANAPSIEKLNHDGVPAGNMDGDHDGDEDHSAADTPENLAPS